MCWLEQENEKKKKGPTFSNLFLIAFFYDPRPTSTPLGLEARATQLLVIYIFSGHNKLAKVNIFNPKRA